MVPAYVASSVVDLGFFYGVHAGSVCFASTGVDCGSLCEDDGRSHSLR